MAILAHWLHDVTDEQGDLLESVQVRIERESDAGLPSLYDGRDSATAALLGNPYTDADGMIDVYLTAGNYKITLSKSGHSDRVLRNVQVGIYTDAASLVTAAGSSFTPDGNLASTTVQAAITEAAGLSDNRIINPQFEIGQRGTTFTSATTPANNDDAYLLDRWLLLSDGNDIVDVSREATTVPAGAKYGLLLDVETANKKFGILQVIEAQNCKDIVNAGFASASFQARKGGSNATVDKLRAAIISWTGTEDTVTSDVVSAWNGEGADPTLVANWTYENTPVDLALTTSFQTFQILAAAIDTASTKQIALFIWCDNSDPTVADLVYLGDVQLVRGKTVPSVFRPRPAAVEYALCQRYLLRITFAASGSRWVAGMVNNVAGNTAQFGFSHAVPFRANPTVTESNIGTASPTDGLLDASAISLTYTSGNVTGFQLTSAGDFTVTEIAVVRAGASNAFLDFDAEL